jgi:starch phosphorylase
VYVKRSPVLGEIFSLIQSNFFSPVEFGLFDSIVNSLLYSDYFLVCADFDAYCRAQEEVSAIYNQTDEWTKRSIINVAKSGKFSSDRTVEEYARDIWNVPCRRAVV